VGREKLLERRPLDQQAGGVGVGARLVGHWLPQQHLDVTVDVPGSKRLDHLPTGSAMHRELQAAVPDDAHGRRLLSRPDERLARGR